MTWLTNLNERLLGKRPFKFHSVIIIIIYTVLGQSDNPVASLLQVATTNSPIQLISVTWNYRQKTCNVAKEYVSTPVISGRIKPGDNCVIPSIAVSFLLSSKDLGKLLPEWWLTGDKSKLDYSKQINIDVDLLWYKSSWINCSSI